MTAWYDRRIGNPHRHGWERLGCGTSLTLGLSQMRSYAEPRPHPIRLGEILEKLEPLGHDFEFHALLRSQDFEVRDAVMQAASVFDDYADRVPEWWRQLEPFTRLPDAGGDP